MAGIERDERRRISDVYAKYGTSGYARRWDHANPGNRAILDERVRALREALASLPHVGEGGVALDIGCGRGDLLPILEAAGFAPGRVVGTDILADRLREARALLPDALLLHADGRSLPLRSDCVELVVAQTLFSSIPDDGVAASIARDVDRVLTPGGAIVVYDLRVPSPRNRAVRAVRTSALRGWFPGYSVTSRTLTLVPPVARRLGRAARYLYPRLVRVPLLRTHRLWVLTKPRP